MSESLLVSCLLKATVLLVLVTNSCVFEPLLCYVCVCVQHREREKSNCWHLAALKVALGFVLFTATWSFHSPPQKKPFSVSAASSHCSKVLECVCVYVCVAYALSVQEHLSQWEKSLFPPKERARRQCQRHWLELATWEGRKRQREGGHLSVKGRGNLWCDPP